MTIVETRTNFLQSNEGWAVELMHSRSGIIKYYDGENFIKVDSEILAPPDDMVIYADSTQYWFTPKGEKTLVTMEEKEKIIKNVLCALDHKNIKAQLYWPNMPEGFIY